MNDNTSILSRFGKDPWSAITHLAGTLLALLGGAYLVTRSIADPLKAISMAAYGISLVGLFAASTAYHYFDLGPRGNLRLRRLDHAAIFALIVGTNVPVLMHGLEGNWRTVMLSLICGLGLVGLIVKLAWMNCPKWLAGLLYTLLGWLALIPSLQLWDNLSSGQFMGIAVGGAIYSLGAVVYASDRPNPWPGVFGAHEVWHLFVLAGAGIHFATIYDLLGSPIPPF